MLHSLYHRLSATAAILLLGAITGFAQQPSAPLSRWSVGVKPVLLWHAFTVQDTDVGAYLIGGTLYGRYFLTPKLTVQTGIVHGRGGTLDDDFADDGTPKYVVASYKESVWGIPLDFRYSLSEPQRKFQVEALLGVSLYSIRQTNTNNRLYTNVSTDGWYPVVSHSKDVNAFLNAGLGFRYSLSSQLQAVTDVSFNGNLQPQQSSYFGVSLGAGAALGLEYRFR